MTFSAKQDKVETCVYRGNAVVFMYCKLAYSGTSVCEILQGEMSNTSSNVRLKSLGQREILIDKMFTIAVRLHLIFNFARPSDRRFCTLCIEKCLGLLCTLREVFRHCCSSK